MTHPQTSLAQVRSAAWLSGLIIIVLLRTLYLTNDGYVKVWACGRDGARPSAFAVGCKQWLVKGWAVALVVQRIRTSRFERESRGFDSLRGHDRFERPDSIAAYLLRCVTVVMRSALLAAAGNSRLQRFVTKHGRRFGADRFVAGETLDEFMTVVQAVNLRGFRVAAGLLGEDVAKPEDARNVAREYCDILERFAQARSAANVALKLTHLGLGLDPGLAFENVRTVAARAAQAGNFVRIDMEQSAYTDATLDIYRQLRARGFANTGTVLQAYLFRSEADLRLLLPLQPNLRLVKGAYLEPPAAAFHKKRDVDANLARLIEHSLTDGGFTAIATHDEAIIEHAIGFIKRRCVPDAKYEFQMLYGVRPSLQKALLARGLPLRIAVPFGTLWYPYLMRRLAERPANLAFFLASLWRG
jgi:proline dehydrogenase